MDARNPASHVPACHRCQRPMVFCSQETVDGKRMTVFRCESCDTLEAFEDHAPDHAATPSPPPRERQKPRTVSGPGA